MSRLTAPPLRGIAITGFLLGLMFPVFAAKPELDPTSKDFFHMVRHFMTTDEERVFRSLSTQELRQEFIDAFWEIRDPDPATEDNEFRNVVEERFTFVNKYLFEGGREGWDTVRGMVYLVLGPPTSITATKNSLDPSILDLNDPSVTPTDHIVWVYHDLGFAVFFVDRQGFGIYELDMANTSMQVMNYLKSSKNDLIHPGKTGAGSRYLKYKARVEPSASRVSITIDARDLSFESDASGNRTARIHLAASLYQPDGSVEAFKEQRTVVCDEEMLKTKQLRLEWTLPLKTGKSRLDLLVHDQIGGKANRQVLNIRKK